jgi:hypothetical protein
VRISGYPPRPGSPSERAQEQGARRTRKEEGRKGGGGGRRGSRLRLGADFGVPSTPREPERASARDEGARRTEEGGRKEGREESFGSGEEEAAGFA